MPGKVPPDELFAHVFERTGEADVDETVLQGPADGEDAAAIDWPGGDLVVSSDPISLAASQVGNLGVHVACNDVAASGADPRWLTVVVLLPDETADLEAITRDLDAAASEVGASIVGGHSEYVDQLERPLVSLTAMGATESFVPTGGAEPGDAVLLTKAAGIEGTAILAADFAEDLEVDPETVDRAGAFLEEISVVPDGRAVREFATAMHDPTEGGVAAGLLEIARASGVRLEIDREAVPVRAETERLCAAAGVDPLRIFGSGALLATVPGEHRDEALEALSSAGIEAATVGTVAEGEPELVLDDEVIGEPVADDLYPLWAAADATE
ncbi:hydrogenase expression/formation protein HypE [Halobiforma haloterrestris]|uniref:Hydrogenase expression/formation protein HypE n=1 Tax=Natronobacterium haloterrestre TaxID=148448 RepID=A0A1I1JB12_NATHA|nr:AIR synthase family protein [Halobiforma haloterrestris]SFC45799.1 hydrogenase expression/formation protein HypE [Halobiforma haloterrestris]